MAATADPQQGDHLFNDLGTAVLRPFLRIRDLCSPEANGEDFLNTHLLHTFSMAHGIAHAKTLVAARTLVATGTVDEADRALTSLRTRFPALKPITARALRAVHDRNAEQFGNAAQRFEMTFTVAIRNAVQAAIAGRALQPRSREDANASMAFQRLVGSAYDPAAALRLLVARLATEAASSQGALQNFIVRAAEAIDRPTFWRNPFLDLQAKDPAASIRTITSVKDKLLDLYALNSRGMNFSLVVQTEIEQVAAEATPEVRATYDGMLYLLHRRVQQLQSDTPAR